MTPGHIEEIAPALSSGRWLSVAVSTIIVVVVILAALATLGRESKSAAHPISAGIDSAAPAIAPPQ
jgi:hypothetical protein